MTPEEVLALPVVIDVPTAGRALDLGSTLSYELARTDGFPFPVLRIGRRLKVRRTDLLRALGMDDGGLREPA